MGKSAINPAVVGKHSTDIAALKNDLGIVEDGDTATHTIAQGQYVIWQGALYTADAAIASGTTLAASGGNKNLTAVENGGMNDLNSRKMDADKILSASIPAANTSGNTITVPGGTYIVIGERTDRDIAFIDVVSGGSKIGISGTSYLTYSVSGSNLIITNAHAYYSIYVILIKY